MQSQARVFLQPIHANIHQFQINNPVLISCNFIMNIILKEIHIEHLIKLEFCLICSIVDNILLSHSLNILDITT